MRLIAETGLNEETGLYFSHDMEALEVKMAPTRQDAEEAMGRVIETLFGEFPFAEDQGGSALNQAGAVLALVTGLCRRVLDKAPGFLFHAGRQGSGKTTLALGIGSILSGREVAVMFWARSDDELRKRVVAALVQSIPIMILDNVPDGIQLKSETLAAMISGGLIQDRILGESRIVQAPTNTLVIVTGNNLTVDSDLSRRLIPIRLEPSEERPELRSFKHENYIEWVIQNRRAVIRDVLTIMAYGFENLASVDPMKYRPSGFNQWDRMVRYPLIAAGLPDPYRGLTEVNRAHSLEIRSEQALIASLHSVFGEQWFRARDILDRVSSDGSDEFLNENEDLVSLKEAIEEINPDALEKSPSLGHLLRKMCGKSIDGLIMRQDGKRAIRQYRILQGAQ